jgi:hypothetical protein
VTDLHHRWLPARDFSQSSRASFPLRAAGPHAILESFLEKHIRIGIVDYGDRARNFSSRAVQSPGLALSTVWHRRCSAIVAPIDARAPPAAVASTAFLPE